MTNNDQSQRSNSDTVETIEIKDTETMANIEPVDTTAAIDADALATFDPKNYPKGCSGDERLKILDILLGWLVAQGMTAEITLYSMMLLWNSAKNKPVLPPMEIIDYFRQNVGKWLQYHQLHQTPTYVHPQQTTNEIFHNFQRYVKRV